MVPVNAPSRSINTFDASRSQVLLRTYIRRSDHVDRTRRGNVRRDVTRCLETIKEEVMSRTRRISVVTFALLLLAASAAFAQGTTGQLTGTVRLGGDPVPGVTITATSQNLQGSRIAVTDVNGNYTLGALPPGDYSVQFEMEGTTTLKKTAKVGVGQTGRIDAVMAMSDAAETITVTAGSSPVLETQQVQSNFSAKTIDELPVARTILGTANLAPGVTSNGPGGGTQISGSYAYDNLFLVNGVAVNENLRGQPHNLFIEDAIQETTVFSGGAISAEFGRFTGGVVSAVTKSGGNDFSGTFRDSLTNDSWSAKSAEVYRNTATGPVKVPTADLGDKVNSVYEATLGGRILRDRLWFFLAGRDQNTSNQASFARSNSTYDRTNESFRYEGKLTGQLGAKHTLIGSYMDASIKATNNCQFGGLCLDSTAIDPVVENPNSFWTGQYNGIFGSSLLLESSYAQKKFAFEGFGGDNSDRILGTPVRDYGPTGSGDGFNAPQFNGLEPETRDSTQWGFKSTYFLGTKAAGTHNIVAGLDNWKEGRKLNNNQSASDFIVYLGNIEPTRDANGNVTAISIVTGDGLGYWPVLESSKGSDSKTNSLFVNDKWDFNSNWSFNVGARYDKLNSVDSAGTKVADDSEISPRVGVNYDLKGDGRYRFNATYGKYVARLADSVAGGTSVAGTPALFYYNYDGPDIGPMPVHDALRALFNWWDGKGGYAGITDPNILTFVRVPGATQRLRDGKLQSPAVNEWTVGFGTQLGTRGFARFDYIDRDWNNFYTVKQDSETGKVISNEATGSEADLQLVYNSNLYERTYRAVQMQASYRVLEHLNLGGNYTWSELRGNIEGETTGSGPVSDTAFTYPEYQGYSQRAPVGYLLGDQRHKLRAWAIYDIPTSFGTFSASVLERFDSGTPYSAVGAIDTRAYATDRLNGYRYAQTPSTVQYYFTERGALRWDDQLSTDLNLRYELPFSMARFFVEGDVLNAFNGDAVGGGDVSVLTAANSTCRQTIGPNAGQRCAAFNPFTETPVEGVNWQKGPLFGKPTTTATPSNFNNAIASYQLPRTYRFSVGVRF
jgi:outer membrane receptor protein involved in Fe transport